MDEVESEHVIQSCKLPPHLKGKVCTTLFCEFKEQHVLDGPKIVVRFFAIVS